jgi:hypothetical protein
MNEETTETTEVTETGAAPEAAPAESVEPAASVETEPAAETAPDEEAPSVYDWNGEVDSLKSSEWFNGLDPGIQNSILNGVDSKYKNWQRGYTKAFQENSVRRKQLEDREAQIRANEAQVQRWLYGDADPLAEKKQELEQLGTKHKAAMDALRAEYAAQQEALKAKHDEAYKGLVAERDTYRSATERYQSEQKAAKEREVEQTLQRFETYLNNKCPDLVQNEKALYNIILLTSGGVETDKAIQMTRAVFPAPEPEPEPEPAPEPEPVPASVGLMNMGASATGTEAHENQSIDQILDQMRRAAQAGTGGSW